MRFWKSKKIFTKRNSIIASIVLVALLLGILIIIDPFYLRNRNSTLNLKGSQIKTLATEIVKSCNVANRQDCYKEKLVPLTKKYGLTTSEAILSSLQDFSDSAKNCHVIAHYMSREAYDRAPWEFYQLIDSVDVNACGSGFLHGVLEAYTGDHPNIPIDGEFANKICNRGDDTYRQRMCIHFVGHIFLLNAYGNLTEALPLCEGVKEAWKFDCYDGIFMEDHQKLILSDHGISPLPPNDEAYSLGLEKTCSTFTGPAGTACWTEMAEVYAHSFGYNSDVVFKRCSNANTDQFKLDCYLKGVVAMSVYPTFGAPQSLAKLCSYYESDQKNYAICVHIVVSSLMYYSPKFITRGSGFCTAITSSYQKDCFVQLTGLMKNFVKAGSERNQLCVGVPENYKGMCLN